MKTVEIELAGRSFRAAMLTLEEDRNIGQIVREMQIPENHGEDPEPMRRLIRGVSEIIAAAIARSGSAVSVDELLELIHASGSGAFATEEAAAAFVRGAHEMARVVIILRAAIRWDKAPAN